MVKKFRQFIDANSTHPITKKFEKNFQININFQQYLYQIVGF